MAAPSLSHDMVAGEHLFLIEWLPAICTAPYAYLTFTSQSMLWYSTTAGKAWKIFYVHTVIT